MKLCCIGEVESKAEFQRVAAISATLRSLSNIWKHRFQRAGDPPANPESKLPLRRFQDPPHASDCAHSCFSPARARVVAAARHFLLRHLPDGGIELNSIVLARNPSRDPRTATPSRTRVGLRPGRQRPGEHGRPRHAAHHPTWRVRRTVYPVNPAYDKIDGATGYFSLSALPETPDLAVLAVRNDRLEAACATPRQPASAPW